MDNTYPLESQEAFKLDAQKYQGIKLSLWKIRNKENMAKNYLHPYSLRNERHSILWPLGANKIRDHSNIDLANLLQFWKQYTMKSKNIHLLISVLAN